MLLGTMMDNEQQVAGTGCTALQLPVLQAFGYKEDVTI